MSALLCGLYAGGCQDGEASEPQVTISSRSSELYVLTPTLWKMPSAIPVCWEAAGLATEKAWIVDSIKKSWETATTALKFTGWDTCTAASKGIRIAVNSFDPEGPHVKGFGSELDGMKDGMVLDLQFQSNNYPTCRSAANRERCARSIAVHEFGHAIGFLHEQERGDTPTSCPDRNPVVSAEAKPLGTWDLMSVMNYCYPDRDTVFPTLLSPADIQGARVMYPPAATPATPSTQEPKADPSGRDPSKAGTTGAIGEEETEETEEGDDEEGETTTPAKRSKRTTPLGTPSSAGCSAAPLAPSAAGSSSWLIAVACALAARLRRQRKPIGASLTGADKTS